MKSSIKIVLFDFDYTLADSSKGICECVNYSLGRMGFPIVPQEQICKTIGLPLSQTFITLTSREHADRADEFCATFKKKADKVMVDGTIVFDTVYDTFAELKQMGIRVGIVSTKFRFRIEKVLKRDGLMDMVDIIIGGEDVAAFKPDPEGLFKALDFVKLTPDQCLFIGDSVVDAETARKGGALFGAVLTGVTTREDFKGFNTEAVFQSLDELPDFIYKYNYIIDSERLRLVPLTRKLWQDIAATRSNMFFKENEEWPTEDLLNFIPKYLKQIDNAPEEIGWGIWLAINKPDGKIVGDIGFKGKPDSLGIVEMGYGIVPGERRKGYATEAARALLRWAFGSSQVLKIKADCHVSNKVSARVLEKIGMAAVSKDDNYIYWELDKNKNLL